MPPEDFDRSVRPAVPASERRVKVRAPLVVQVDARGQDAFSLGRSQNVSESGLFMRTPETLSVGSEVTIRFALPVPPQAITIEATGIVVRAHPGIFMAIQFVDLKEEYREAIARFANAPGC